MDIWADPSTWARKSRWDAFWAMEDLPRPLWFIPAQPVLTLTEDRLGKGESILELIEDGETQVDASFEFMRMWDQSLRELFADDYVISYKPEVGVGAFASAFGCELAYSARELPGVRPVIQAGDPPQKVYDLKPPAVTDGALGEILKRARRFDQRASGSYPVCLTDHQGPTDTAYLIWSSTDFITAMFERPQEVHHLMQMVTDLTIEFVKASRSQSREFVPVSFPPLYLRDRAGMGLCEDLLAVLSPQLYEQFSLPYINKISEEFGGVVIHSCGNISHQLPVLKKVHNLKGLNFGVTETPFEAVWECFGGKIALIPHCSNVAMVARFETTAAWIEHILKVKTTNRGLALMVDPTIGNRYDTALNAALGRPTELDIPSLIALIQEVGALINSYS